MYVRGCVLAAGFQAKEPGPASKLRRADQITAAPGLPTASVATTASRTTAGCVRRNETIARSRKPSPFGLTVDNSGRSPANGRDPSETWSPTSWGAAGEAASAAARSSPVMAPG